MATLSEALAIAVAHYQEGRLDLAEEICRRILAADPNHVDTLHLAGRIAARAGQDSVAVQYLDRAVRLRPDSAEYRNSLGNSLYNLALTRQAEGRPDEAIAGYEQAIAAKPDSCEAYQNLGGLWHLRGELEKAAACYARAIELRPDKAELHSSRGALCYDQGKLDEAVACFQHALAIQPGLVEAHTNLGTALAGLGRLDEAAACCRHAIELRPDRADAHFGLANALRAQGDLEQAVASYRRCVELKPDHPGAHNNLGIALKDLGRLDEAVTCLQRVIELRPGLAETHSNLGTALVGLGRLDEAVACFRRALQYKPDRAETHNNLGTTLTALGRYDEALACYRHALLCKPDCAEAQSNLAFTLQYRDGIGPGELAAACAEFDRRYAAPLRSTWSPHANPPDPKRTLRLGFLSADFGRHPVGYLYLRTLECLREEDCQILCYSTRVRPDELTARFQAAAHTWREVPSASDEALVRQIRDDGVDILFDLASHAVGNRLLVFARRPAPIQIAWAGPTGVSAIDYLLTDASLVPAGAESFYSERVLRLPDSYACYEPPAHAPPVGPLPALGRDQFTLGSLNNPAKITPRVIDLWAEVLRRLPAARLVVRFHSLAANPGIRSRLAERLAAAGVAGERIDFREAAPYEKRLDVYNEIDLALDTFPFSGCTTTCEALWMGVPVVTLPGETYLSRQSLSILRSVGLEETAARDRADYVDRAIALAEDLPRLAALRARLRPQMAASPLCDGQRFAGNLMRLLHGVWHDWCRQQRDPQ